MRLASTQCRHFQKIDIEGEQGVKLKKSGKMATNIFRFFGSRVPNMFMAMGPHWGS